jgi:hypothetical protein
MVILVLPPDPGAFYRLPGGMLSVPLGDRGADPLHRVRGRVLLRNLRAGIQSVSKGQVYAGYSA